MYLFLKQVGYILMLPWLAASIGMLVCSFLSDYLFRKILSLKISRSLIIGVWLLISAISFIPAILPNHLLVAILSMTLSVGFGLTPSSCFYALNSDLARERAASSAGNLYYVFNNRMRKLKAI